MIDHAMTMINFVLKIKNGLFLFSFCVYIVTYINRKVICCSLPHQGVCVVLPYCGRMCVVDVGKDGKKMKKLGGRGATCSV